MHLYARSDEHTPKSKPRRMQACDRICDIDRIQSEHVWQANKASRPIWPASGAAHRTGPSVPPILSAPRGRSCLRPRGLQGGCCRTASSRRSSYHGRLGAPGTHGADQQQPHHLRPQPAQRQQHHSRHHHHHRRHPTTWWAAGSHASWTPALGAWVPLLPTSTLRRWAPPGSSSCSAWGLRVTATLMAPCAPPSWQTHQTTRAVGCARRSDSGRQHRGVEQQQRAPAHHSQQHGRGARPMPPQMPLGCTQRMSSAMDWLLDSALRPVCGLLSVAPPGSHSPLVRTC